MQEALRIYPAGEAYALSLAKVEYTLGMHDEARTAATVCIDKYPPRAPADLAECYFVRARTCLSTDPPAALSDMEHARTLGPLPIEYQKFFVKLYARLCRETDAEKAKHDALEHASSEERQTIEKIPTKEPACTTPGDQH